MSYGGKIYEPDLRRENNGHLSLNIASSAHSLRLWIAIEMQLYLTILVFTLIKIIWVSI